jgi:hypothetical protein
MRIHRWISVILLILSILPIGLSILYPDYKIHISFGSIPIVITGSVFLNILVARESSGKTILNKYASLKKLDKFLPKLVDKIDKILTEDKENYESSLADIPMHEWHNQPLNITMFDDDPIDMLVKLSFISIVNNDSSTFADITKRIVDYTEYLHKYDIQKTISKDYDVQRYIKEYMNDSINIVIKYSQQHDNTFLYTRKLLNVLIEKIIELAKSQKQDSTLSYILISHINNISIELIQNKLYKDALKTVIASRKIIQMGIDNPRKDSEDNQKNDIYFTNSLDIYFSSIKILGEKAIECENSDFLYRCLDSLGWVGCSAARKEIFPALESCLHNLVQLGRLARKYNLNCFDSHCALTPFDHTLERIQWIASWLLGDELIEKSEYEVQLIAEAVSRLRGYKTSITIDLNSNPKYKIEVTNEPHIVTSNDNGTIRKLNYADVNMISNFQLFPGNEHFRVTSSFNGGQEYS